MTFQVFLGVFTSVSDAYFKCFICLQASVANILSGCFKSRSGVAHVSMTSVTGRQRPTAGLGLLPRAVRLALSSPSTSLPFPPSRRGSLSSTWTRSLAALERDGTQDEGMVQCERRCCV
jgi:hypothetical protein